MRKSKTNSKHLTAAWFFFGVLLLFCPHTYSTHKYVDIDQYICIDVVRVVRRGV